MLTKRSIPINRMETVKGLEKQLHKGKSEKNSKIVNTSK